MTKLWKKNRWGRIEKTEVPEIRVKIIKEIPLTPMRSSGLFAKARGLEFVVILKRDGVYSVDLTPLGFPGECGYLYDSEVEEVGIINNA